MIPTFRHRDFAPEELAARKDGPVSVVLPAKEEAATIAGIVEALRSAGELIDEVVVIDAASADGTADRARAAGATVYDEGELLPEFGTACGKGDAMWRALSVVQGDYVVYLDSDTLDFCPRFAVGLLGALLSDERVRFVKGAFRRPFTTGGSELPDQGGRVTELCARPLLAAFYPPLAEFAQPLAGEIGARREVLEEIPFATDFGVEIGMLIDVYERFGIEAMAQADLGERRNQHQPLVELGRMAYKVQAAVLRRLRRDGRLTGEELPPYRGPDGRVLEVVPVERPPIATLRSRA